MVPNTFNCRQFTTQNTDRLFLLIVVYQFVQLLFLIPCNIFTGEIKLNSSCISNKLIFPSIFRVIYTTYILLKAPCYKLYILKSFIKRYTISYSSDWVTVYDFFIRMYYRSHKRNPFSIKSNKIFSTQVSSY